MLQQIKGQKIQQAKDEKQRLMSGLYFAASYVFAHRFQRWIKQLGLRVKIRHS